jgi:hypothetical protein
MKDVIFGRIDDTKELSQSRATPLKHKFTRGYSTKGQSNRTSR